jgi:hypothetical protein
MYRKHCRDRGDHQNGISWISGDCKCSYSADRATQYRRDARIIQAQFQWAITVVLAVIVDHRCAQSQSRDVENALLAPRKILRSDGFNVYLGLAAASAAFPVPNNITATALSAAKRGILVGLFDTIPLSYADLVMTAAVAAAARVAQPPPVATVHVTPATTTNAVGPYCATT